MDTSETYIKMCKQAKEIHTVRVLKIGDYFAYLNQFGYLVVGSDSFPETARRIFAGGCLWLPRQDQLQEIYKMARDEDISGDTAPLNAIEIAGAFNDWLLSFTGKEPYSWLNDPTDIRGWVLPSMEQLWLAFVMEEKHGKIWTGSDWQLQ